MSFKFNWGHGILLVIIAFMLFILSFVYRSLFGERYDHKLVNDKYYEEEIHYQEEIDRLNNARELPADISTKITASGLEIHFPAGIDYQRIKGNIILLYMKNRKYDYKTDFTLTDSLLVIPGKMLLHGNYHLKVNWTDGEKKYQYRQKIFY